jgi:hypothetical protein
MKNKPVSFIKNHADTMAILGVNIAIGAIALSICLTNISSIAAVNARQDALQTLIHDEIKDFHGRLCVIEERNRK